MRMPQWAYLLHDDEKKGLSSVMLYFRSIQSIVLLGVNILRSAQAETPPPTPPNLVLQASIISAVHSALFPLISAHHLSSCLS